jgi:hypothetical protein
MIYRQIKFLIIGTTIGKIQDLKLMNQMFSILAKEKKILDIGAIMHIEINE